MILLKFKGIESGILVDLNVEINVHHAAITIATITYSILYYIDDKCVANFGKCGSVGDLPAKRY